MIHLTRKLIRRWLDALLHIDDTPNRTAAAFALGVFFGFSPFLGLHTVLALSLAFFLNLNRVAVLLGVYANLPWLIAPYYTFATMLGARALRTKLPPALSRQLRDLLESSIGHWEFWHRLAGLMRPLLWPYLLGSLAGAVVLATLAYPTARAFIRSRRRLKEMMHQSAV